MYNLTFLTTNNVRNECIYNKYKENFSPMNLNLNNRKERVFIVYDCNA